MLSNTTIHDFYHCRKNCLVEDKLHRLHSSSSKTVGIVLCPSTRETGVLTLRLTRALVFHHTPPTQRVEIIGTTGTIYMLGTLLYGYLVHLHRGEGFIEEDIQALTHSVSSGCCDVVQSLLP